MTEIADLSVQWTEAETNYGIKYSYTSQMFICSLASLQAFHVFWFWSRYIRCYYLNCLLWWSVIILWKYDLRSCCCCQIDNNIRIVNLKFNMQQYPYFMTFWRTSEKCFNFKCHSQPLQYDYAKYDLHVSRFIMHRWIWCLKR